jgi:hypothetical protein
MARRLSPPSGGRRSRRRKSLIQPEQTGHRTRTLKDTLIKYSLTALIEDKLNSKVEDRIEGSASNADRTAKMWKDLSELAAKYPGGDVSMVRPDGTVLPPFDGGKSIIAPWGIAVDGNDHVWVANNWDLPYEGFKKVPEPALATRFGGNGVVVFFGLAKPVRTPLIGPPRQP